MTHRHITLASVTLATALALSGASAVVAADSPAAKAVAATPTAAPIEHHGFTAIYQASYKGFPLQATHRLEKSGKDWFFSSIASGFFGQIEENANFLYTDNGISTQHYSYQRSVLGHDSSKEITFNQKDKVAASSNDKHTYNLKLGGGELDSTTYILALRDDIARGAKEPCYKVIDDNDIETYCFRVTGTETIDTALGKLDTVALERVRKADSKRKTRIWLAPSLDYSIAKLEHQEEPNQMAYSLEITYYRVDKPKP